MGRKRKKELTSSKTTSTIPKRPPGRPKKDVVAPRGSRLKVLREDPDNSNNVIVQCSCKDKTVKSVRKSNLVSGLTTSCGCKRRETSRKTVMKATKARWGDDPDG